MVSHPTYDPQPLASHDLDVARRERTKELNADPDKPLVNRAIAELYPPGSTFKLVTAAAALSTGKYTEDTVVPGPAVLDLPRHARPTCPTSTASLRPQRRGRR